ncbi:hypothetical protein COCOR_06811 [Corallococcus coralloides DSM 2259]|uniref:Uncharacterized protein n=1 Tax=Corallococcus coralloides (strain ATCC 25202 / DSM 2259 / NBRC 100086 / M2) TaxID=1144275 RepID=H8MZH5_CORCM|nr:hypothetical protein [Corallococcus coralloides]AFE07139.1 hypothetical protein COCOR_06811 [Corallococcus coralloides DSM 2259]
MHGHSVERVRDEIASTRRPWPVLLAALLMGATGCHHAGRHAVAQQMQASFKEARLSESLNDERELSQKMLDLELAAVRRSVDVERDNALTLILGQPLAGGGGNSECSPRWSGGKAGSLLCDIDFRIERLLSVQNQCLMGSTDGVACAEAPVLGQVQAYVAFQNKKERNEASLKELGRMINLMRKSQGLSALPLTCSTSGLEALKAPLSKASPGEAGIAMAQVYVTDCTDSLAAQPPRIDTGLIPDAQRELDALSTDLDQSSTNAKTAGQEFDAALAAYDEAVSKGSDVKAALESLKTKLDLLGSAKGNAHLPEKAAEAAARYDAVVLAINHILEGKPGDTSGIEQVLVTAIDIDKLAKAERLPVLLLEAERLRGQAEAANARLTHAERQRTLLRTRIEALRDELRLLLEARRIATGPARACATAKPSLMESLQEASGTCKIDLATALIHYGNSWSIGERRARIALVQLNGDLHQQALDLSAVALRQWENVLAVPINAVVERHAGGVKPEDLARLLVEIAGFTAVGLATAL